MVAVDEDQQQQAEAFVADLRALREAAGRPSFRTMALTAHYSHTALSGVLSASRLPSLELTLAFVRACGGDEQQWAKRWRSAGPAGKGGDPLENPPVNTQSPEPAARPGPAGKPMPARHRRWAVLTGAL